MIRQRRLTIVHSSVVHAHASMQKELRLCCAASIPFSERESPRLSLSRSECHEHLLDTTDERLELHRVRRVSTGDKRLKSRDGLHRCRVNTCALGTATDGLDQDRAVEAESSLLVTLAFGLPRSSLPEMSSVATLVLVNRVRRH